jgi:integrase
MQQRNRGYFGSDYRADLDLVFCGPDGDYLKPDSVSSKASLIAKKAGLNKSSLHSLRHSYGSLLLSAGVPLPTVSKLLGHSSTYVTATVYSHAIAKDEAAAAETWDAVVQPEIDAEKRRRPS